MNKNQIQAQQARNLENYKGKKVIVHAVVPFKVENKFKAYQKVKYAGVYEENSKFVNTLKDGYLNLDIDGITMKCLFLPTEHLTIGECCVRYIQDAETKEIIYKNNRDFETLDKEILGNGVLSGLTTENFLAKFEGKNGVLASTSILNGKACMSLMLSNKLTYCGGVSKNFRISKPQKIEEFDF